MLPFAANASAGEITTKAGTPPAPTRTVQTPRVTDTKPGGMTCHTPACTEIFYDECLNAGGIPFEDPITDQSGAETGAAELDCL